MTEVVCCILIFMYELAIVEGNILKKKKFHKKAAKQACVTMFGQSK